MSSRSSDVSQCKGFITMASEYYMTRCERYACVPVQMRVHAFVNVCVILTIESSSAMKTVHACACMKDRMVPENFLSNTSRHCCSSKMRLARSNSTCKHTHTHIHRQNDISVSACKRSKSHPPDCVCSPAVTSHTAARCGGRCPKRPNRPRSPGEERSRPLLEP